ncbi:TetR/AcrR family transcriptional regulator [Nocardia sp. NPDC049220]|uniref:TetR/AcrR family transcriptional regulator n=1 Tax=Nocardia sp. NPDC049220 TaxID=3155273 RepID=UPI00340AE358
MQDGQEPVRLAREGGDITDRRLLRGAKTRAAVLRQAVDIASLDGLTGLSFGRLANETGLSKAGIQTLFRTKEALQLATVDYARGRFAEAVVDPARTAPHGLGRLLALVESWMVYAETPLFAGGCFRVATMAEFDSKPGPVRDALLRDHREWVGSLERELRFAVSAGEIATMAADQVAFQLDAVLCATNTAFRIGDTEAADRARRAIEGLLRPA